MAAVIMSPLYPSDIVTPIFNIGNIYCVRYKAKTNNINLIIIFIL